jgi:hypothetical protein
MPTARLEFHPLTFVEDRDGVTIGRADTESYAVLPSDGAALLRQLVDGMPVEEAAAWYETRFGETVDMADFLEALHELGFVRVAGAEVREAAPVRLQAVGRALFSPAGWFCFGVLGLAALVVAIAHPELRPHAHNVFFTQSLLAVQLAVIVGQTPLIMVHEGFHVLAGRRLGLPTRLSIGRRYFFAVFETHLNGLHGVPKRQRYLPFLAGMVADAAAFAGLTLLAWWGGDSLPGRLALALAFATLLRLVWQSYVFLRTDLYYLIVTMLGCTDLYAATSDYLRRRFSWLPLVRPATVDEPDWSPRDRQFAPAFAGLTVLGLGFLVVTTAYAVAPVVVEFGRRLFEALSHGLHGGALFWDSVVSLTLIVVELVVLPLLAGWRSRRNP